MGNAVKHYAIAICKKLENTMSAKLKPVIWSVVGIAMIAGVIYALAGSNKPGNLDVFAQCLKEKKATFYGAFWCPHCQNQKALFGSSVQYLPYVECSTPDAQGQLPVCQKKKIQGYPTWEFADGNRESGEISLKRLSEKTRCPMPQ